jgi:hypothetical protein
MAEKQQIPILLSLVLSRPVLETTIYHTRADFISFPQGYYWAEGISD